jgi:hypothetical protein
MSKHKKKYQPVIRDRHKLGERFKSEVEACEVPIWFSTDKGCRRVTFHVRDTGDGSAVTRVCDIDIEMAKAIRDTLTATIKIAEGTDPTTLGYKPG